MDGAAPIGIFGGTFDPIHYGHLRLAEEGRDTLRLAQVVFVPAGKPPHRDAPRCAAEHRYRMTELALAGNADFRADDLEIRSEAPSYTVDTLARLRIAHGPQRPLVLLLGVDAFLGLPTWHRWRELFSLAHVGVASRPGYPLGADQMSLPLAKEFDWRRSRDPELWRAQPAGNILTFDMTPLAISASSLRRTLGHGHSVRYLLPEVVLDYIGSHQLYL